MTDRKPHNDWGELKIGYIFFLSQTLKNEILRFFKSLNNVTDI